MNVNYIPSDVQSCIAVLMEWWQLIHVYEPGRKT